MEAQQDYNCCVELSECVNSKHRSLWTLSIRLLVRLSPLCTNAELLPDKRLGIASKPTHTPITIPSARAEPELRTQV